jgi:hypothetical protein
LCRLVSFPRRVPRNPQYLRHLLQLLDAWCWLPLLLQWPPPLYVLGPLVSAFSSASSVCSPSRVCQDAWPHLICVCQLPSDEKGSGVGAGKCERSPTLDVRFLFHYLQSHLLAARMATAIVSGSDRNLVSLQCGGMSPSTHPSIQHLEYKNIFGVLWCFSECQIKYIDIQLYCMCVCKLGIIIECLYIFGVRAVQFPYLTRPHGSDCVVHFKKTTSSSSSQTALRLYCLSTSKYGHPSSLLLGIVILF